MTKRREKKTALKFLRKEMRKHGRPEAIITDRLRSSGAALKKIHADGRQASSRWMNNRAENSHLSSLKLYEEMAQSSGARHGDVLAIIKSMKGARKGSKPDRSGRGGTVNVQHYCLTTKIGK